MLKCMGNQLTSLVPRPRPAFRRFQYGKAGTASDGKLGGAWNEATKLTTSW